VICSIIVAKTARLPRPSETVVGSNVDFIPVGDEGLVARIGGDTHRIPMPFKNETEQLTNNRTHQ
jgi:hypothetical protein